MLGLMLWHQATGDPSSLSCACRIADLICAKYLGDRYPRLVETGSTEMNLAPVHALSILARQTRHPQYLAMARQIVAEFGAQADGRSLAGDWLRLALAGTPFFAMPKPRWESLHPIMGLAELYWTTGEAAYREAFEHIWWSIAEADRHNNGGFSSGEQATGNPYDPRPIETCCTIAWIATSVEMLKLTGNSVVADEIELSTLNSVVGMHSRSGRWATYNTPSDGARFASAHYIVFQARSGSPELNCCSVNRPRGLGMIGDWAVMQGLDGLYLNYYGPARIALRLDSQGVREHQGRANRLEIVLETDYPRSGHLVAHIRPELSCELAIFFRIPYWSAHTDVTVNGERVPDVQPGTYLSIERTWRNGDIVELDLDMSPHFWRGERECGGLTSAYRGPLLLAYDHRYNRSLHTGQKSVVYGGDPRRTSADALLVPTLDARSLRPASVAWDDWLPPTLLLEAATADGRTVRLCDYASAGQTGSLYWSWLPFGNCPNATGFSGQNPLRSTHSGS
jgi:DUF1680 family protein